MNEQQPILNLQEKRDIGQVINVTFTLIRITFKPMYKDLLLIAGPFYLLGGIFSALTQYHSISTIFERLGNYRYFSLYQFFSPEYYLYWFCILAGWSLSFCIAVNHVLQYKINGSSGYNPQEVRRAIMGDVFKVFFGTFLNILAIIGASLFFLIPGIYLLVANSLLATVLVLDKQKNVFQAFSESRRLISDNWWRSLGLGILILLIMGAISMIFALPMAIANFIITFNSLRDGGVKSYLPLYMVLMAITQLGTLLVSPISNIASAVYYYSLKEEKDHSGLMDNIGKIGTQDTEQQKDEGSF